MDATSFYLAANRIGEWITIRRLTGTQRISFGVECRGFVNVGGAQALVSGLLQNVDEIRVCDREMRAKQWPSPPHHGDQIVYGSGRVTTIYGEPNTIILDGGDLLFVIHTLGA